MNGKHLLLMSNLNQSQPLQPNRGGFSVAYQFLKKSMVLSREGDGKKLDRHRSIPIAPTVATLPDVRPTLDPQTLPVMQLCQPCHCHRWNHPKTR